jgi:hypothetical protein
MRVLVSMVRIALALAILAAVVTTHLDAGSRGPVNPFNLYGYFTIQSNLIAAVVLLIAGIASLAGRTQGLGLSLLRAIATTILVIVGIVYAVLLAPLGAAGGVPVPWANVVLHILSPIVIVLDWLLVGDRLRLRLSQIWAILVYPIVWTAVVLIRGATDGWVPYPFLNPAQGYGVVAAYAIAIAAVFAVVGVLVLLASRTPGVLLRRARS